MFDFSVCPLKTESYHQVWRKEKITGQLVFINLGKPLFTPQAGHGPDIGYGLNGNLKIIIIKNVSRVSGGKSVVFFLIKLSTYIGRVLERLLFHGIVPRDYFGLQVHRPDQQRHKDQRDQSQLPGVEHGDHDHDDQGEDTLKDGPNPTTRGLFGREKRKKFPVLNNLKLLFMCMCMRALTPWILEASDESQAHRAPVLFLGSSYQPISCFSMDSKANFLIRRVKWAPEMENMKV